MLSVGNQAAILVIKINNLHTHGIPPDLFLATPHLSNDINNNTDIF